MNNIKKVIRSPKAVDWEKGFPVIELTRLDLELFFSEEDISRLSDDDMAFIACRYGDLLWSAEDVDELCDVAKHVIEQGGL